MSPIPTTLLRVPPFPGSRAPSLVDAAASAGPRLSDAEVDRLIGRVVELQVGGNYWGSQPRTAESPYTLIRVTGSDWPAAAADARPESTLVWRRSEPVDGAEQGDGRSCVVGPCDPWHLIRHAAEVIVDADDELALIAAMAGIRVRCVGTGPFADLQTGGRAALRHAFRRCAGEVRHVSPFTGDPISVGEAVELCGLWRRLIDSNRCITAAVGFAFWKQPTVAPLLWAGSGEVPFTSNPRAVQGGGRIAVWKSRTSASTMAALQASGADLVEVEDGFLRSRGLGADCVPPLSIVVDQLGAHFDPGRPSELEMLLQGGNFGDELLARAAQLRQVIVGSGLAKYEQSATVIERSAGSRRHILVPGQVEDDRSILLGGCGLASNLDLLRRVREQAPEAYIIYKPHPDVVAGHRKGAVPNRICLQYADQVADDLPIASLIDAVDELHVNTSLAGFEALMRGKSVTTYGVPFYSGWGLTRDLGPVPSRRTAKRTVDELVAATLLLYPRYLDPVTHLPCPAEVVVDRLIAGATRDTGLVVAMRRMQGRLKRELRRLAQ